MQLLLMMVNSTELYLLLLMLTVPSITQRRSIIVWAVMCGFLVDEVVPIHLLVVVTELEPRAAFHRRSRPVLQHFSLKWWHQKATTEDLACVIDCKMDVLPSLALSVKLDEALSAEKVYTVLTKKDALKCSHSKQTSPSITRFTCFPSSHRYAWISWKPWSE